MIESLCGRDGRAPALCGRDGLASGLDAAETVALQHYAAGTAALRVALQGPPSENSFACVRRYIVPPATAGVL